jgi:anaerobic ribonucleoside-triphosphate reductase activating protein
MLRYLSYNIVFQEVPDEVTLAINISNCPNGCKGCHSPFLQEDKGDMLDEKAVDALLAKYGGAITCVCFMGGDVDPLTVERLSLHVRRSATHSLKTAWYSGKAKFPEQCSVNNFGYVKLGPYIEAFGGLDAPTTNQRFYRIEDGKMIDQTERFRKKQVTLHSQLLPD